MYYIGERCDNATITEVFASTGPSLIGKVISYNGYCWEIVSTTLTTSTIFPVNTYNDCATCQEIGCLENLKIETIYLELTSDLALLPAGYTHPCQIEIGQHQCNRALFEVYGNGVYIGDSRLNNDDGALSGATTINGTFICGDYDNTPALLTGGTWTGSPLSRYSVMTINQTTAQAIAAVGGNTVTFSLLAAMTTYGASCSFATVPHANITWTRITDSTGKIIYNGCPNGNIVTINVCTGNVVSTSTSTTTSSSTSSTSTSTSTSTTSTTTTLPPCQCYTFENINETDTVNFSIKYCGDTDYTVVTMLPGQIVTACVSRSFPYLPSSDVAAYFCGQTCIAGTACADCRPVPSTTTTSTTSTTTTLPFVNCINGLTIETIYLDSVTDLDSLPRGYSHPCPSAINEHQCNGAFFEVYGNGVYMADSLLNNLRGTGGATTISGKLTCTDYANTPPTTAPWGTTWSSRSRYSKTVITAQQAVAIANAGGPGSTTVNISYLPAMTTYGGPACRPSGPHTDVNWLRITAPDGRLVYNGCVVGNSITTLDLCNFVPIPLGIDLGPTSFSTVSAASACATPSNVTIYGNTSDLIYCTKIYSDPDCNNLAPAGFYKCVSPALGVIVREWSGTVFLTPGAIAC